MNYSLFLSEPSNKELHMYDCLKKSEKITVDLQSVSYKSSNPCNSATATCPHPNTTTSLAAYAKQHWL